MSSQSEPQTSILYFTVIQPIPRVHFRSIASSDSSLTQHTLSLGPRTLANTLDTDARENLCSVVVYTLSNS